MAVSKRLRFEVLRRDNHTCRYCGRSAPEVKLVVDHVLPVALGGKDGAENLVAACEDCNTGKGAIAPDSPIVDDVQQDALRWSRALAEAARIRRADRARRQGVLDWFQDHWNCYRRDADDAACPLDADWRESICRFFDAGLEAEDIESAVRTSMSRSDVILDNKFRYFCGVAWRRVGDLQELAAQVVDTLPEPSPTPARAVVDPQPREVSQAQVRDAIRTASSKALRTKWQGR